MFHGLKDNALLPAALNNTWEWVDQDLTLMTLPQAGHWSHWEAADQVTGAMQSWLAARR
jgi:pimeloyl-ACP methyl ester carboxylesterase